MQSVISTNGMESHAIFIYRDNEPSYESFVMLSDVETGLYYGKLVFFDSFEVEHHVHRIDKSPWTCKLMM